MTTERDATGLRDVVTPHRRREQFRRRGLWTDDTLASRVNWHAETRPDALAVVDSAGGRGRNFRDLARDGAVVADLLKDRGVRAGDVVSMQLPNRYEAVVSAVAIQSLGAVINPLLPNYRAKELAHVFKAARPRVIITPDVYRGWNFVAMIDEVVATSGLRPQHLLADRDLSPVIEATDGGDRRLAQTPSEVSELIFTSGTEAIPKAVIHGEANTNLAARTIFADLGADRTEVVWMPSPVGHSTGFNYGIRVAAYHGSTLVLQDIWQPRTAIDLIQTYGCNYTLAATTFLRDLVEECERSGVRLPSLVHFGCGGAPVAPELVERADAVGICVLRLYGSTEVLCATWNRPADPPHLRTHTDGRPLSHTEVDVRDERGSSAPIGEPGELYIRSAQASVGFYDDETRTAATYQPDGWIRSGDLAVLDGHGHITIVGRKKEIIIRGGVNITPREIEDMLATLPEIDRAAVIGLPDDRLGERACACVVFRPGQHLELPAIASRLASLGLATYKLPERLHVADSLPMTASGKVQKPELVRLVLEATLLAPTMRSASRTPPIRRRRANDRSI